MELEVVLTCPLGHQCEEARDGKIYRCRWFQHFRGENPQTGDEMDKWDCAIPFGNVIELETSDGARRTMAAVVDLRNHVASGNKRVQEAIEQQEKQHAYLPNR